MGKNIIFIIFIISLAILLIGVAIAVYLLLKEKKLPETYNCYVFAIFWTPSSCRTKYTKNYECFQTIKELGIEKYFTLHGLWPSVIEGIIPPACNEGYNLEVVPNFDSEKEFKDKMDHYWPGLYQNNTYLWKHEYNKHGLCYMKRHYINFIDDYKKYFEKSVNIFENGYRNLMEEILPDMRGLYDVSKEKFRKMISKSTLNLTNYQTYGLQCHKETGILTEIWFFLDLNYNPTTQKIHQEDCPDVFKINFTDASKLTIWEKYDYYVFAVQYSPNVCVTKGEKCYAILNKTEDYRFGIHGLWPSYKSGIIPKECNIGEDIQIKVADNIDYYQNYVLKHWYSLYNTDDNFLTHEYNTHGYCYIKNISANVSDFEIYINKTLELYQEFDFSNILKELIESKEKGEISIRKEEILKELEKTYKKDTFALRCNKINNKMYLSEIHFKIGLDFKLITDAKVLDTCKEELIWLNIVKKE